MIALPDKDLARECVVLADGDFPASELALEVLRSAGRVICCDGAVELYAEQIGAPFAIVGDGDSITEQMKIRYADRLHIIHDQSMNDLTKAMRFAVGQGFGSITILGATGRREDHTLGNISLLWEYMELATVEMITDRGIFNPMQGYEQFESRVGQQVSIFGCGVTHGVHFEGLSYRLPENRISSWWSGTLNEATGSVFGVRCKEKLLIYREL